MAVNKILYRDYIFPEDAIDECDLIISNSMVCEALEADTFTFTVLDEFEISP